MYVVPLHSCKFREIIINIIASTVVLSLLLLLLLLLLFSISSFFPFFQVQDLCRKNSVGDYVVIP